MGNCKDCRYWTASGECVAAEWLESTEQVAEDGFGIRATAADDWNLDAALRTGPMFGCVKFQPAERKVSPQTAPTP